ncbi:MAG: EAL domain-containing protein [Siculibacillus sp.]
MLEAIDTIPDGFVVYDADDRLVLCNRAFRALNADIDDLIVPGVAFADLLEAKAGRTGPGAGEETRRRALGCGLNCGPICADWNGCRGDVDVRSPAHSDGTTFETTLDGRWHRVDEHRTPSGLTVGLRTDLTDIRDAQSQLARSEAKFRALYALAPVGIARTAVDGRIVDANPAFAVITGSSPNDRRSFADLFDARDRDLVRGDLETALAAGSYGPVERRLVGPDGGEITFWAQGTVVRGADGEVSLWTILQDISDRKRSEARIWHAAHHDVLTGLPNRKYLSERLAQGLTGRARIGLLLIDLDNFKLVNDTLGHEAGDVLLQAVAERLEASVRGRDFVARLGGDEFAVVAEGIGDMEELRRLAERIFARFGEEIAYRDRSLRVGASVGMALAPDHGSDAGELLRFADLALYEAKRAGRNRAVMFETAMQDSSRRRFEVLSATRTALAEGRIVPHYQPIVDLATGGLRGLEALCRVEGESGFRLEAGEIFQHSDLGREVDRRMIDLVTDDMARWRDQGFDFVRVAINVCDAEFWQDGFDRRVIEKLAAKGIDPSRFGVEVTESTLLEVGGIDIAPMIGRLRDHGLSMALDDFGTGFASLTHLKNLPVDRVKIDRSFIGDIVFDSASRAIVEALVRLGRGLGKEIVAEGIETEAQQRVLEELGCALGQGHLFGRGADAAATAAAWREDGRAGEARRQRPGADVAGPTRRRVV